MRKIREGIHKYPHESDPILHAPFFSQKFNPPPVRQTRSSSEQDASQEKEPNPESQIRYAKLIAALQRVIRCPCGMALERSNMVQCSAPSCGVWQHSACVHHSPDEPKAASEPSTSSSSFTCELCRLEKGNPFFQTVSSLVAPSKLRLARGTAYTG